MSHSFGIQEAPPAPAPPVRKGRPLLAWLVIVGAVGFILWRHWSEPPGDKERYDLLTARVEARYLVGVEQLEQRFPQLKGKSDTLYPQADRSLNRHTYAQRLRFVVMAGELKGPAEAREQLRRLDDLWTDQRGGPPADDAVTARLLDKMYTAREKAPEATGLTEDERQELRRRLGWFGDLALAPPGDPNQAERSAVLAPAWWTMVSLLAGVLFLVGVGILGLTLLVVLFVWLMTGQLRGGVRTGSPYGGVYAETFAVYMLLFLGLSYGASWLPLKEGRLLLGGLAALGSLAALAWPVLRGVPWRQVRYEIGWHPGRRPWLEPFLGLGTYAMALPMLLLGALIMLGLQAVRDRLGLGPDELGPSDAPAHPIVFWVARAGWWVWLEVFFVASVVAPVVEETMFRGVLYRHLREATSGLRPALSVLASALLVSYFFAVIHPQGLLAVPALMALALAFNLVREWRGTLLPSMIAHGVNNGVATLLLFLMVR